MSCPLLAEAEEDAEADPLDDEDAEALAPLLAEAGPELGLPPNWKLTPVGSSPVWPLAFTTPKAVTWTIAGPTVSFICAECLLEHCCGGHDNHEVFG